MAKIKMKTRKSASKRLKLNRTGKIMRNQRGRAHNTGKKSSREMRRRAGKVAVADEMTKNLKRMLAKA